MNAKQTIHPKPGVKPPHVTPNKSKNKTILLVILGIVLFCALPVILLGTGFIYYELFGEIYPGVSVGDVDLGGLTKEQAASQIEKVFNQEKTIIITDGDQIWSAKASDFGLWVNPAETAEAAWGIGRGRLWLGELLDLAYQGYYDVSPSLVFKPDDARKALEDGAIVLNQPAKEAYLTYQEDHWIAVPGESGSAIDIEKTLLGISADPRIVFNSGYLMMYRQTIEPQVKDLSKAADQLENYLPNGASFTAYDPITDETMRWEVPRQTMIEWLAYDLQPDGNIEIQLNLEQARQFLVDKQFSLEPERDLQSIPDMQDLLAVWREDKTYSLLIIHNPVQYTIQSGERLVSIGQKFGIPYWHILQANPDISANNLSAGQVITIPSPNELIPLPVVMGKRIVISLSQQRLWTYENGNLRSEHIISTGIESSPTHPGVFQVQTHELNAYASVWDLYMPHFLGIYEGWPGFMNGIHGLPTLSSGRRLWADVLGRPASYGCIILDLQAAEDIYNWAEDGVIVQINP